MHKFTLATVYLLLICGCSHIQKGLLVLSGNPYVVDSAFREEGRVVFTKRCGSCHGLSGRGDGDASRGLEARLPNFADGTYTKSLSLIAGNVTYGKRQEMPAFKAVLSDREIWAVAAFIENLAQQASK